MPSSGVAHVAAVIIEIRSHPNLQKVLLNFDEHLPPKWPIHLVHGWGNDLPIRSSAGLAPALLSGRLQLRHLGTIASTDIVNAACTSILWGGRARSGSLSPWNVRAWYNFLLMTPSFWHAFNTTSLLLFEADTSLCPQPDRNVASFTRYLMVGAPQYAAGCFDTVTGRESDQSNLHNCVGNSGLSLWDVKAMRSVLSSSLAPLRHFSRPRLAGGEVEFPDQHLLSHIPIIDMWSMSFFGRAAAGNKTLLEALGKLDGAEMPSAREAALFSVSGLYSGGFTPFGVHSPTQAGRMGSWPHNSTLFKELKMRCPAVANVTYKWHPGEHPKDASSTCQYGRASPSVEGEDAERVVMKSELSGKGGGLGHGGRGGGGPGAGRRGEGSKGGQVSEDERYVRSRDAGKVLGELGGVVAVRKTERPRDDGASESSESGGGDGGLGDSNGGPGRGEEGSRRGKDEHLLERLAYHYGTDKSRDDHKYTDQYAMLFDDRRFRVRNVTEVGVSGGQSLQVWAEYFPRAQLWGVDLHLLDTTVQIAASWSPRITLGMANSLNATAVQAALPGIANETQDLIIDDGLHSPGANQATLGVFWRYVRPGGYYIIEDMPTGADVSGERYATRHRNPDGFNPMVHNEAFWTLATREIMHNNDVTFVDTLAGTRSFNTLKSRMTKWMTTRVNHNSHMLIIRKRSHPPPAVDVQFKKASLGMAVKFERLTEA